MADDSGTVLASLRVDMPGGKITLVVGFVVGAVFLLIPGIEPELRHGIAVFILGALLCWLGPLGFWIYQQRTGLFLTGSSQLEIRSFGGVKGTMPRDQVKELVLLPDQIRVVDTGGRVRFRLGAGSWRHQPERFAAALGVPLVKPE